MILEKQTILNILTVIAIIIICYLAIIGFKCLSPSVEKFSDFKSIPYKDVSKNYMTSKTTDILINGMIYKYFNDGAFQYLYKLNLPIPTGGDYNKIEGEYIILAGTKQSLEPIGKLHRSSDGWFYLEVVTEKDYKYTQLIFNVPSDPSKNSLILDKIL